MNAGESYKLHWDGTQESGLLSQGGLNKQGFIVGVGVCREGKREISHHVRNIAKLRGQCSERLCKPD